MKVYQIIFKGRVQGVGFRYQAKTIADKLGLSGTIKNLYNGDVEVYIKTSKDQLNKFIEGLKNLRFVRIENYTINELENKKLDNGFQIVY